MFALLVKVPLLSVGRKRVYWHQMTVTDSTDCWAQEKEGCGKVDLHNRGRKAVFFKRYNYLSTKRGGGRKHSSRRGEIKKDNNFGRRMLPVLLSEQLPWAPEALAEIA